MKSNRTETREILNAMPKPVKRVMDVIKNQADPLNDEALLAKYRKMKAANKLARWSVENKAEYDAAINLVKSTRK